MSFLNDYSTICHPEIAKEILKNCQKPFQPYYEGEYTLALKQKVKDLCGCDVDCAVMVGGTQTNVFVIANLLRPFEAVVAPSSAHINVHEAGAVEHAGRKIMTAPTLDGKIAPKQILEVIKTVDPSQAKPKMVCISQPTEVGTLYSLAELVALYQFCQQNNLYLFIDGARLGSALTSSHADFSLEEIAQNCHAFYLGGTKSGLPIGELLIYKKGLFDDNLFLLQKQAGVLLAKGDWVSMCFDKLLPDLFYAINRQANETACYFAQQLKAKGVVFWQRQQTNQLFVKLSYAKVERLKRKFDFCIWESHKEFQVVRLVCTYLTTKEQIDQFIATI